MHRRWHGCRRTLRDQQLSQPADKTALRERLLRAGQSPLSRLAIASLPTSKAGQFRLVVFDLEASRPIWVGDGNRREDLDQFFSSLTQAQRDQVSLVNAELDQPLIQGLEQHLPSTRVMHSRALLERQLNSLVNQTREQELDRFCDGEDEYVRGSRYILLSYSDSLKEDGVVALRKRIRANQRLHAAALVQDAFSQFWECRDEDEARQFFQHWREGLDSLELQLLQDFGSKLEHQWSGIMAGLQQPAADQETLRQLLQTAFELNEILVSEKDPDLQKLVFLNAFLPEPGPQRESKPLAPGETPAEDASSLDSWLKLLCDMLPSVEAAAVFAPTAPPRLLAECRWPGTNRSREELALELVDFTRRDFEQGLTQIDQSESTSLDSTAACHYAFPLRRGGEPFGILCLLMNITESQRTAVAQLLNWAERWLLILLDQRHEPEPGMAAPDPRALRVTQEVLQTNPLQAALLTAVNKLASEYSLDRVYLGMQMRGRQKLRAVSHGTRYDQRTETVQHLEAAMNEVAEANQSCNGKLCQAVAPGLVRLAKENDSTTWATPLHHEGKVVAVLVCETMNPQLDFATEEPALEGAARLLGPVLAIKQKQARGVFGTFFSKLKTNLRSTAWQVSLAGLVGLTLLMGLVDVPHRVDARANLEGQVQRAVVAPFNGFVADSTARSGDIVNSGDLLARLDDGELMSQWRQSSGEVEKLQNEYRQALASLDRAEAAILQARLNQARARTALLEKQLSQLDLKAPLDGVVVSGDLSRSLGAPVERGQVLFEVSPLDQYRIVLHVDEAQINSVAVGQEGTLALTAAPGQRWPFIVKRLSPVFQTSESGVVYRVEALIQGPTDTLRPGMEGYGKIDIGNRSLGWVLFHQLANWLRVQLWLWSP